MFTLNSEDCFSPFSPADQKQIPVETVWVQMRRHLIYTVCCSVFDFRMKPLFASLDMSRFKDERFHFRNKRVKRLSQMYKSYNINLLIASSYLLQSYIYNFCELLFLGLFSGIFINPYPADHNNPYVCKQCRSRSDGF